MVAMIDVQIAAPGDEPAIEAFLAKRAETSMFLRSNLRTAGVIDHGQPLQATWALAWSGGELRGVAAHCWNRVVLLQAPAGLAEAVRAAVAHSGRAVGGLIGPYEQVVQARGVLGLDAAAVAHAGREFLFSLELDALVLPDGLSSGELRCRRPRSDELPVLAEWRAAYAIETLGKTDDDALRAESWRDIEDAQASGSQWVLERDGRLVAYSGFNARLPDMVQVGGVFTPPTLRGRGYARAVVAGSLRAWAEESEEPGLGRRAILFTGEDNLPAQRAYEALGFRRIGAYGAVLFA